MHSAKLLTAAICILGVALGQSDPEPDVVNVNYGAFTQTATYSIAKQLGVFEAYGLNVTYLQIPNSTFGYNSVLNGGYDVLTGTIDNVANLRFNQGRPLTVLGQLDAGPDITIASVANITSILDLRGKSLMVDSATSGYAFLLRKILSLYGLRLENNDYSFVVVGSTNIRYAALRNGTYNGQPVYATILTYPFTAQAQSPSDGQQLNILARASDFVAPFASSAITANEASLSDPDKVAILTRFVGALYEANRYLASTEEGAKDCAVQAITNQLGITTAVAELEYAAATDPLSGEISTGQQGNLTVDRIGLLNVLDVRTQFGGFGNATNGFNFIDGITPGTGKMIDYTILEAAIAGSRNVKIEC
ncbi:hypothetical protein BDZ85DRAFT_43639 [Elsinoe ampelina]|uniref:SsuA/THI5-like domain-containing protein n=1 Tax=Elsinoe ampelina TaxID=302913 RepID=A0A6A6G2A5_9PEZI|nr:hypothetical protein BDZ85DRAFT_43639 [Elsinoe ampelina]